MITGATAPNCQQCRATINNGDVVHSWHGYNPHAIDLAIRAGYAN